jgi:2-polyprenyl-3-methyl-5-hydroxy-6-metoxy-1,4-benzoquinol methylase
MGTMDLEDVKPYYKNPRDDVMPFFPSDVKRLLDVGCGAGAFGEAVKASKGCDVWGIELVPEMGELARERLDKVMIGDACTLLEELPHGHFDLITFNDALEHMAEPWEILAKVKPLLSPRGKLLVSLPNIRYWDALLEVGFGGDFPYQDFGIFDRTHLRFFTKKSIRRLFEESGYRVERLEGINPTPSRKLKMVNLVTGNRFEDCRYLQFVTLASPA